MADAGSGLRPRGWRARSPEQATSALGTPQGASFNAIDECTLLPEAAAPVAMSSFSLQTPTHHQTSQCCCLKGQIMSFRSVIARSRDQEEGFTLIELMVVVLIIAI